MPTRLRRPTRFLDSRMFSTSNRSSPSPRAPGVLSCINLRLIARSSVDLPERCADQRGNYASSHCLATHRRSIPSSRLGEASSRKSSTTCAPIRSTRSPTSQKRASIVSAATLHSASPSCGTPACAYDQITAISQSSLSSRQAPARSPKRTYLGRTASRLRAQTRDRCQILSLTAHRVFLD